jgi:hypothetical protein
MKVRRSNINMTGLKALAVFRVRGFQCPDTGENMREKARIIWGKMEDDKE